MDLRAVVLLAKASLRRLKRAKKNRENNDIGENELSLSDRVSEISSNLSENESLKDDYVPHEDDPVEEKRQNQEESENEQV